MADHIQPRSTPAQKKRGVIPWRPLLLIAILLILAFPAFKFGTGAGQRIWPAVSNFFYNISAPPPPPTPTPLPPLPASLPQFGSLLYTVQPGDSCDEILAVQMHMADAGQVFSDANPNTVKALSNVMGHDCHAVQPGMILKLPPQYPLAAVGGVVLKVDATTPQQPIPTPLINVARQQVGIDCSNGCLLAVRIAPGTQVRLLIQTALPVRVGSWVWAQAMLARQQITGFPNYPYVDPNVSLNGMLLRACDLQVDNTHDDNSLACSQLLPNTIIDDGGAWLFGITGPGSLDHWHYPLRLPAGTQVLLWLSAESHGGLVIHQANPIYRYDVEKRIYAHV